MKLKFKCGCKQRIRVPVKKIGTQIPCPHCEREVTVPPADHESIIEITCRCGETVAGGESYCLACGLAILESIAGGAASRRSKREKDDNEKEDDASGEGEGERKSARRGRELAGPIEIPSGRYLSDKVLVKFFCACGQKVRLKYKQRDRAESCPRCKETLRFPDVTTDEAVEVICPSCQSALATGDEHCKECGRELILELAPTIEVRPAAPPAEAVPAGSLGSPRQEVPSTQPAAGVAAPFPSAPKASAPLPSSQAGPERAAAPLPPASKTEPLAAVVDELPDRKPRRRSRERQKKSAAPALLFTVGFLLALAGFGWLFFGDRARQLIAGEVATAEDEAGKGDDPAGGSMPWDRANPFGDPPDRPDGPDRPDDPRPDPDRPDAPPDPDRPDVPPDPDRPDVPPDPDRPDVPDDPVPDRPIRVDPPVERPWDILMADDAPAEPPIAGDDPGVQPAGEPDLEFFRQRVQPLMEKHQCFVCHANDALPVGEYRLKAGSRFGFNAATSRQNFERTLPFINRSNPAASPFLSKALAVDDGGATHGGGDNFRKSDDSYGIILDFLRGSAPGETKPVAEASPARQVVAVGDAANLDGSASRDPVGKPLKYRWRIGLAPPRSGGARILNESRAEATLRGSDPGVYVAELVVIDSAGTESAPARVVVEVRGPVPAEDRTAPPSALDRALKLDTVRRMYGALIGRSPGDAEVEEAMAMTPAGLARRLVGGAEFWRAWHERDLDHLRLSGAFAPTATDLVDLPIRLANGEVAAPDALRTVLAGEALGTRYPDPADAARALHQRLVGRRSAEGAGDAGLAARLLADEDFFRLYLERHHRALLGKAPPGDAVSRWTATFRASPEGLRGLVEGWVTSADFTGR